LTKQYLQYSIDIVVLTVKTIAMNTSSTNQDLLTNTEKAYKRLLEAILDNSLPKGVFLSQRKLSELAKTSVVTVREALKKLEYDGLIESIPRWGVRIPVETRQSLIERYRVREALEVMAAYLISRDIDREKSARLRALARDCDTLNPVDVNHADEFCKKHQALHMYLAECTGNTLLKKELERLNIRSIFYQSARRTWARRVRSWDYWHQDLIEEILSGDPERAQEAMHRHIEHGLKHDLAIFDRENKSDQQAGESQSTRERPWTRIPE
jgi:DNA-binding GntR family transcriptional regulator